MAEPVAVTARRGARPFSKQHIPALDGIRGLAILSLLLFKATEGFHPTTPMGAAVEKIFGCGWMGVDLFFVLSGFLITGILLDTKDSPRYFRNFYARRTLRIFPLYYGVLLITFVVAPWFVPINTPAMQRIVHNQGWLWTYTTNIGFVLRHSVFFDAGWLRFNHFWSLAIEEQFYLAWPVLVLCLNRRSLAWTCGTFILVALGLRMGMLLALQARGAMFYPTPCRIDSLAIGALTAIAIRRPDGIARLLPLARTALIACGALLVGQFIWRGLLDVNDLPTLSGGFTIIAILAASLLVLAMNPAPNARWRGVMQNRTLRLLGKFSYAIYVLHMLVLWEIDRRAPVSKMIAWCHGEVLGMVAFTATVILMSWLVGVLSWHVYEKHFLRAKRFFV